MDPYHKPCHEVLIKNYEYFGALLEEANQREERPRGMNLTGTR